VQTRKRKPWVTSDADAVVVVVVIVIVVVTAAAAHLHATIRSPHARFLFLRATVFRDD
jgi:hypothetical protein